jgi:tyrosyl-tRNA synthetase
MLTDHPAAILVRREHGTMKLIRFAHHYVARNGAGYNPGEVAGFPDDEAAEIVGRKVASYQRTPATLEELEAEESSRGASRKAAKKLARERFDGVHGEEGRYLDPEGARGAAAVEANEDVAVESDQSDSQPSLLTEELSEAEK